LLVFGVSTFFLQDAKIMTFGTLALLFIISVAIQDRESTGNEFDGVWSVNSIHQEGKAQTLEKNALGNEAQTRREDELIICRDRLVVIETDGSSMACKMKLVATKPQTKYALTTGSCHDQSGETTYMILVRDKDKLTIAWVPPEATEIDASAGGKQIVITAHR
jgi:hypothetical protein